MTSDAVRRQRVANGSRRKRDLQAAGMSTGRPRERWQRQAQGVAAQYAEEARKRVEREARLRPKLRPSETALDAWSATHATLLADLRKSTFMLWVHPLSCIGEAEDALCLSAPDHVRSWCERRYGALVGGLVRDLSDFAGIYLLRAEEPNEEDTPL